MLRRNSKWFREVVRSGVHPLLPHIGKLNQWIVGPDGDLWLTPWNALLLPSGDYVVEKHAVSYVTAGRDLALAARSARQKGQASLIVADPDFDLSGAKLSKQVKEPFDPAGLGDGNRGLTRLLGLTNAVRLPYTEAEAEAITPNVKTITGAAPRVLLGEQAIKEAVKNSKAPRVLVLSTHGFFHSKGTMNPLDRCGLLLADLR